MGQTNFTDVVVDDAEELAIGRGQLTTQLTAIKADVKYCRLQATACKE